MSGRYGLSHFSPDLIVQLDLLTLPKVLPDIPQRGLVDAEFFPLVRRHVQDIFPGLVIVVPLDWNAGHVKMYIAIKRPVNESILKLLWICHNNINGMRQLLDLVHCQCIRYLLQLD